MAQQMAENLTKGQRTYEERRAAQHGMSLDQWLVHKDKKRGQDTETGVAAPKPRRGIFSRLFGRSSQ